MRSGRKRSVERTSWPMLTTPGFVRECDAIFGGALKLARVLDKNDAFVQLRHFRKQRVGERGLAGAGAASNQDVFSVNNSGTEIVGLVRRDDAFAS